MLLVASSPHHKGNPSKKKKKRETQRTSVKINDNKDNLGNIDSGESQLDGIDPQQLPKFGAHLGRTNELVEMKRDSAINWSQERSDSDKHLEDF